MSRADTPPARAHRRPVALLAGLLAGVLALTAAGCAKAGKSNDPAANQGLSNVDGSASATPGAGGSASGDGGGGTGGASTSASPTHQPTTQPSTQTSTKSGPVITSFKVTQQPLCLIEGTSGAPFHQDARDIILAWAVTGATGVQLYLDGGLYNSYPAVGSQSLYFACNDKPNQTHQYKLVTTGGGSSTSKTITVTATNNPPTN